MALKDNFEDESKIILCDFFLDEIEKYGLGSMLKSDQDALIYHILASNIKPGIVRNRHDWIRLLKVKPSRLNTIQETASVKYGDIENTSENWLKVSEHLKKNYPEVRDRKAGTVVIYIDDAHIYRFLEYFLNQKGSSPEYQLNKTQLVFKYERYVDFLTEISRYIEVDTKGLSKTLRKDKSEGRIDKTYNDASAMLSDLKEMVGETTVSEATVALLKVGGTALIKYFKNRISGS